MSLLYDKHPLLVNPRLAALIGLNEAIVLQQIHYWTEKNRENDNNLRDGYYWTYNTYEEWQKQFPFWSRSTVVKTFVNLGKANLLIIGNYNKLKIDRTKWYRVNYDIVKSLE